jgi:hypothetical protein
MALAWPQGRRILIKVGDQFPICKPLGAMLLQYNIVILMKSTLLIKVNPKPNILSSPFSFHLSSFFFVSLLVELLHLFVNDRKGFFFFSNMGYGHEKHKNYKILVSIFIHDNLTFRV